MSNYTKSEFSIETVLGKYSNFAIAGCRFDASKIGVVVSLRSEHDMKRKKNDCRQKFGTRLVADKMAAVVEKL
jgi:hypothetical protein